mmetsp:Transcript_4103/g.6225  ORF Transcript_4103/g.6225 Transcript_4103/m.6225 type:complete len:482 (-) Transcript_4103:3698-5143(-)
MTKDGDAFDSVPGAAKRETSTVTDGESSDAIPHPEDHDIKASIAGIAGNILEWYDFAVFGYFSDIIGLVFFPPDQKGHAAIIESFAVFGGAFLVRPIGGAILGIMGDTHGRKGALETSILLMAFPTFALGCLPSFSTAGWVSPVLLIICRLLQGFSVGGQLMTSVIFTLEKSEKSRWGLWSASVFAASGFGVVLGSLFSYILRENLTDEQLESWGWRLPFLFGAFGAIPGAYLKLRAKESAIPQSQSSHDNSGNFERQSTFSDTFGPSNRRALIAAAMVPCFPAATYYVVMIWMAIFMETLVDPPVPHAFGINTAVGVLAIVHTFLGGYIADLYGNYAQLMVWSGILIAITAPLALHLTANGDPGVAFTCQFILSFLSSLWNGAMLPWMVQSFPPHVRLTSCNIGYNTAVMIAGGFSPAIATLLVDRFSNSAPGYILTFTAAISLLGLYIAPNESYTAQVEPTPEETEMTVSNRVEGHDIT